MKKAIFLDRDGVLIEDCHLIRSFSEVQVLDGVYNALALFREMGYLLFILSNQSVVARGLIGEEDCLALHEKIEEEICRGEDYIKDRFLCFYHPHAQVLKYKREHKWRKPSGAALKYWSEKYNISLEKSFMIGDRTSDVICGKQAGCTSILIERTGRVGKNEKEQYTRHKDVENEKDTPDFCFDSLFSFSQKLKAGPIF
tara:strand:+ start:72096 stop:72692 length:597 start_codon:yes stop_codon:yes gene_type:complete